MKNAGFLVALALLALVGGAVGYLLYQDQQTPAPEAPSANKVFADDLPDLSSFAIVRAGEEPLRVVTTAPDSYRIETPASYAADTMVVGEFLGALRTMEAERVLEGAASSAADYGLNSPSLRIETSTADKQRNLLVGGMNPTGSARYAMLEGGQDVYLLPVADVNTLNKSLGDLRQKRALGLAEPRVKRLMVETPQGNRELVRTPRNEWTFGGMSGFRADGAMMNQLASSVITVRSDASSLNREPLPEARFRSFPLVAEIRAEAEDGMHQATIRRSPEGTLYASSNDLGGAYPVQADIENFTAKPIDEFRNLRLFDFGFSDVFNLHYNHVGTREFTLRKPNQDWLLDGKAVDSAKANKLVDELRSATAAEFRAGEAPGSVTHVMEVEVANGAKERVEFRKAPEASFAVRVGESGYYRVPESFLPDLEKAAAEIKP